MDEDIIFIEAKESGERIDALLTRRIEGFSRSFLQKLIDNDKVMLNGLPVRKNYRSQIGDIFEVSIPNVSDVPLIPQNIPLDICYEDSLLIVINKPRGLVVHPAPGHPDGTLVNALLFHCGDTLSGIGGEKRPGIVHRIDKDTSGLLVVAKTDYAHHFLSSQLSDRTLSREYEAVVHGSFRDSSGTINRPIGRNPTDRKKMAVTDIHSRPAITDWSLTNQYNGYAHVHCSLRTGRTHQIRVHMASIGHPLLGDSLYGAKSPDKGLSGQCLHAKKIRFIHPDSKKEIVIETDLPEYFKEVLAHLGNTI